jgi:mono/diheme cytochrome c family protein
VCVWFAIWLGSTGSVQAAQAQAAKSDLARKAYALLKLRCYACHGENGIINKNVAVLDRDRLTAARVVLPGDAHSPLLAVVRSGQMPPSGAKLTTVEIETLRQWIVQGAPDWQAQTDSATSRLWTQADVESLIEADLKRAAAPDRRFLRYFNLTDLANSGATPDEIRRARLALSKLLNSLSWSRIVTPPQTVDASGLVARMDLRDYKWTAALWNTIERVYPYQDPPTETLRRIAGLAETEMPYLRADWFTATASIPPLYHSLLQLPANVRDLQQMFGVDGSLTLEETKDLIRAGFHSSGVARSNRVAERRIATYGAFWRTYDFASSQGEQNIFRDPLHFKAGNGEYIFHLPNGMQAYYIADGEGRRLDRAPVEVVADHTHPSDPAIVNGRSCMGCHAGGMNPLHDDIRAFLKTTGEQTTQNFDRQRALAVYVPQPSLNQLLEEDTRRFALAMKQAGGDGSQDVRSEPINALATRYSEEVSLREAAAEMGLPVAELRARIPRSERLKALGLEQLLIPGGGFKRDVWEENYIVIARALEIVKRGAAQRSPASGGILIAAPDSWPTSDSGFGRVPESTTRFVLNVANFFTGGKPGNFLVYSTHWGFGGPFQEALKKAGHTITWTMTPGVLDKFDAVFVGGDGSADRDALQHYIERGGKVYVATGTAFSPNEGDFWNQFLAHFGLELTGGVPVGDGLIENSFDPVPIFDGVTGLLLRGPRGFRILKGDWPNTKIIATQGGVPTWAIYTTVATGSKPHAPSR